MALTICPQCNDDVSDEATICPHCGVKLTRDLLARAAYERKQKDKTAAKRNAAILLVFGTVLFVAGITYYGEVLSARRQQPYSREELELLQSLEAKLADPESREELRRRYPDLMKKYEARFKYKGRRNRAVGMGAMGCLFLLVAKIVNEKARDGGGEAATNMLKPKG